MEERIYNIHKHCDVVINLSWCNADGMPALCCKHHRNKHNQLCYIKWLSKKEYGYLKFVLGIEEVIDDRPDSYGNYNAYFE